MAKKNGAAAHVELSVSFEGHDFPFRRTTVVNVEKYEHKDLLTALHKFYTGKLRYSGMPKPFIDERKVNSR